MKIKNYIGTKSFYKMVILLILPMIVQQGISTFVNLLDNIMVGRLGTESMSGVAIVNQVVFVFNLTLFGGLAGASIFGAQFFGNKDDDGVRYTFRFRMIFCVTMAILAIFIFLFWGESLISLFLNGENTNAAEIALTMQHAKEYMYISLWGLIPFAIVQCFSSTLRDTSETVTPMISSTLAILINLVLNYLLIFGNFGFPRMGVAGAALATVIARYIEAAYIIISTVRKRKKFTFIVGAFRSLYIPSSVIKKIARTGSPLFFNELLWAIGMAIINQSYSTKGLVAVAAININGTVWNLFALIMMAMGNAIGILAGQQLGSGNVKKAKDWVKKLITFNLAVNLFIGAALFFAAPFIPRLYNTEPIVRQTATQLIMVAGAFFPLTSYVHATYFTIRSGGKTGITFLFDCVFTWVICLPIAFFLCRYTGLSVVWVFFFVHCADFIKAIIGTILMRSGIWAHSLVKETEKQPAAQIS